MTFTVLFKTFTVLFMTFKVLFMTVRVLFTTFTVQYTVLFITFTVLRKSPDHPSSIKHQPSSIIHHPSSIIWLIANPYCNAGWDRHPLSQTWSQLPQLDHGFFGQHKEHCNSTVFVYFPKLTWLYLNLPHFIWINLNFT